MTWDAWTFVVLGLAVLSVLRPAWATMVQRRVRPSGWRKQSLERAGGGAAMLTVAAYLMIEARQVIGRGYWDMVVLAVDAPFMRSLPSVWVPALCWVLLVVLGLWFLFRGAGGSRGPRDSMAAVWAMNEVAIFGVLLWWGVYVPDTWKQGSMINFGLEGIYLGFLVGGVMRFLLVMRGPDRGSAARQHAQSLQPKAKHWLGRFRRY
ncbi:MAG: hypothetical protein ABSC95_08960 [Acetobacteraceae bacterium]|jgi:hypothetical protein